jgi:hypothetical protein
MPHKYNLCEGVHRLGNVSREENMSGTLLFEQSVVRQRSEDDDQQRNHKERKELALNKCQCAAGIKETADLFVVVVVRHRAAR